MAVLRELAGSENALPLLLRIGFSPERAGVKSGHRPDQRASNRSIMKGPKATPLAQTLD
jgi:hypothetical protein